MLEETKKITSKAMATAVALFIPLGFLVSAETSSAAGVNDITSSVRYGSDGRVIGSIVPEVSDHDDSSTLLTAPWPMNFFGRKYTGLCVTSNGTISPVVFESSPSCDNSYDDTLAGLAESADAPLIAAFANDNHTNRTIHSREYAIASVIRDPGSNIITVTTSQDHTLQTGDSRSIYFASPLFDNGNTEDLRIDEYWFNSVSITSTGSRTFTFSGATANKVNGSGTYTPQYSAATESQVSVSAGWVWNPSSANQDDVDDGVGAAGSIYVGTTTIDGRDAWVYTNYRTLNYENRNPSIFTNTFQIVLIKRETVGGATNGFNFDIEYNYGTVTDGEDGYTADGLSCSGLKTGCRTGVGLADWDPISETADVYELFPNTPSRDLVDRLSSGMTNNRLNSTINGRYTFSMIGGAVQSFATPVMDGTGQVVSRPVVASPTDPVPSAAGLPAGSSALLEDGQPVAVSLTRNNTDDGLIFTSGSFTVSLAGLSTTESPLLLDSTGNLVLDQGGLVSTTGSGFAANSPVKVYAFSNAFTLGTLFADSAGAFSGSLPIPTSLTPGVHNIQLVGYDSANKVKVLTLGVLVRDPNPVSVSSTPSPSISAAPPAEVTSQQPSLLAQTGFDTNSYLWWVLMFLVAGLMITISSRGDLIEVNEEDMPRPRL